LGPSPPLLSSLASLCNLREMLIRLLGRVHEPVHALILLPRKCGC